MDAEAGGGVENGPYPLSGFVGDFDPFCFDGSTSVPLAPEKVVPGLLVAA